MSLPKNVTPFRWGGYGTTIVETLPHDDGWTNVYMTRSDFDAQEARIAAVLAEVDDIDERIRTDGSALGLSEIGPLLDAARAMRRTT